MIEHQGIDINKKKEGGYVFKTHPGRPKGVLNGMGKFKRNDRGKDARNDNPAPTAKRYKDKSVLGPVLNELQGFSQLDLSQPSRPVKNELRIFREYKLSVVTMEAKAEEYFLKCEEVKRPQTLSGLCNYLNISKATFANYAQNEDYRQTVAMIKQKLEQYAEEALFILKNVQGAMFTLTNHYKWSQDKGGDNIGGQKIIINIAPSLHAKYANSPLVTEIKQAEANRVENLIEEANPNNFTKIEVEEIRL